MDFPSEIKFFNVVGGLESYSKKSNQPSDALPIDIGSVGHAEHSEVGDSKS